jgi:hypothetical protein
MNSFHTGSVLARPSRLATLSAMQTKFTRAWCSAVATWVVAAGFLLLTSARAAEEPAAEPRLRFLIETDAGGDPDDEQSMVRFLLYVNEWDVEGIIANRALARDGENRNRVRTGPGIVRALIRAYGECWTNLVQHDAGFPRPEALLARTVDGHNDTDDGVKLLIAASCANEASAATRCSRAAFGFYITINFPNTWRALRSGRFGSTPFSRRSTESAGITVSPR